MNRVVAFFSADYGTFVIGNLVSEDISSKQVRLRHPALVDWKGGSMIAFSEIYKGDEFVFRYTLAVNDASKSLQEAYRDYLNNFSA